MPSNNFGSGPGGGDSPRPAAPRRPSWLRRRRIREAWRRLPLVELLEALRDGSGVRVEVEDFRRAAREHGDPHSIAHVWLDDMAAAGLEPRWPDGLARPPAAEDEEIDDDDDGHDLLWEAAVVLWERLLPGEVCPDALAERFVELIEDDLERARSRVRAPETAFLSGALETVEQLVVASLGPFGHPSAAFFDLIDECLDDLAPRVVEWLLDFPGRLFAVSLDDDALGLARDLALVLDAPDLLVDAVDMLAGMGRPDEAREQAEQIPRLFPDSFGLLRMALACATLGDADEADRLCRLVLRREDTQPEDRREARELRRRLAREGAARSARPGGRRRKGRSHRRGGRD